MVDLQHAKIEAKGAFHAPISREIEQLKKFQQRVLVGLLDHFARQGEAGDCGGSICVVVMGIR